jgi:hypothetical protein
MGEHKSGLGSATNMHTVEKHRLLTEEINGHLYLVRKSNHYYVWLGRKANITILDDEGLSALIAYRLEFDARCCARVN